MHVKIGVLALPGYPEPYGIMAPKSRISEKRWGERGRKERWK
jgi:hypothetical protein